MKKIRYIAGWNSWPLGFYNPYADEIVLDSRLLKYPKLHQYILKHETQHYKLKRKVWKHMVFDLREMYRYFSEPEIYKMVQKFGKNEKVPLALEIKIYIANGIICFLSPFIMIAGMCKFLASKTKKDKSID